LVILRIAHEYGALDLIRESAYGHPRFKRAVDCLIADDLEELLDPRVGRRSAQQYQLEAREQ
jgi:hypothetical protein